ncbi:MAG: EcsC family protein [Peptostreptococcaceae bacterium]|nr:EcsC family protein [Peptostreptococcaceae bacterium]
MNKYKELIKNEILKMNDNEERVLNLNDTSPNKKSNVPDKVDKAVKSFISKASSFIWVNSTSKRGKRNLEALKHDTNLETLSAFDKDSKKIYEKGASFTYKEGGILGAIGVGIPDIPLFLAVLLRGMHSISAIYGFDYKSDYEKHYILKLLLASLSSGENRKKYFEELDTFEVGDDNYSELAHLIAAELIVQKLVQGIFIIGAVAAITNKRTYIKVMKCTRYKYRQRFLNKLNEEFYDMTSFKE